jgi:hypothetical protein
VVAEAVSSPSFQAAVDKLDEQRRFEIEWAISAIEDDPTWDGVDRYIAPSTSFFSGFIIDFSVEGFGIVYRVVDKGAAVELWFLYELPPPPKSARRRRGGPVPMM